MSEARLQKSVLEYCKIRRVFVWRMSIGAIYHQKNGKEFWRKNSLAGFPDLCGVFQRHKKGQMFAIELKSEKGKIAPHQQAWMDRLDDSGASVLVARSLRDVEEFLIAHKEIMPLIF